MSDPSLQKLQGANVPPYLKEFQRGATNSIHMLSLSFNGILEGFQFDSEKIKQNTQQIEKCFAGIENCEILISGLDKKIQSEIKQVNLKIEEQRKQIALTKQELTDKINTSVKNLTEKCENIRTECITAVEELKKTVGESLANVEKLKTDFIQLKNEVSDNIRSLSDRVSTNATLIAEQESKFKKQLNELTQILHQKALELDEKIEASLKKTKEQIEQFNNKLQEFLFNMNQELSKKADITDLQRKLDIEKFETFFNEQTTKNNLLKQEISELEKKLSESEQKNEILQNTIIELKSENNRTKLYFEEKIEQLANELKKHSTDELQQQLEEMIMQQIEQNNAEIKEELVITMQQVAEQSVVNNVPPPSIGTSSGMCIACGRGPPTNSFSPLKPTSKSPQKKPVHGGGFNRLTKQNSVSFMDGSNSSGSKPGTPKLKRRMSVTQSKPQTPEKAYNGGGDGLGDTTANKSEKIEIQNDAVQV